MTSEKIKEVIALYRAQIQAAGFLDPDFSWPYDELLRQNEELYFPSLAHCYGMLDQMDKFIDEGRTDKAFRWLGFVQGILWMNSLYSLTDIMNHNRQDAPIELLT
jgi:hypothetical protein